MKERDSILFSLPLFVLLSMAAAAVFLYGQFTRFEKSFAEDAKANIAEESRMAQYVLLPLLNAGKIDEAANFCREFGKAKIRLSLIDLKGKVLADSVADTGNLSNHLNRPEVRNALEGRPGEAMRYSTSLDCWMMYHAVRLTTAHGDYVLRIALSTDAVSRAIDQARIMMAVALLLGCWLVLPLFLYIYNKIRKPLLALLKSTERIASGDLTETIQIPEDGVVREIALAVSSMGEQLNWQINRATADKNEKETILNAMTEIVLLVGKDGEALLCNRAGKKLFGLKKEERTFHISRCGIPQLPGMVRRLFEGETEFEQEMTLLRNGLRLTLFVKAVPLSGEGAHTVLLTMTDLTNLRKLESFRSDFIANVSHEIRTPLTCIVGAAETLEEDSLSPEQKHKMLEILSSQSKRMNALVQDILSLAALEQKQCDTLREFAPVDLDSMLENAVNLCRGRAVSAGVALQITRNDPVRVNGDSQLLEQAVTNLVNNALNYSGSASIEVSLVATDSLATIEVKDFGVGIAPEHQSRIFERFYRVQKERSRELGGTGLGLAIVKHICQLHHGRAELESQPGKGCVFRLVLPR
ncbi:MAG: ATP-binding protein [Victivallaceae bacterium]|nr:ATP-binding protein [Victivallaceae bacterium]